MANRNRKVNKSEYHEAEHSVGNYLAMLGVCYRKARRKYPDVESVLHEMRVVSAVARKCLKEHGFSYPKSGKVNLPLF